MGFECGIMSRMRNTNNKKIELVYLGNLGNSLDNFIIENASKGDAQFESTDYVYNEATGTYNEVSCMVDNEDQEYNISREQLENIYDKILPAYQVLLKYSDRVIYELSDYLSYGEAKPKEIKAADLSLLKDLLFNINLNPTDMELYKFYLFCIKINAIMVLEDDLKKDLIYWRSY